MSKSTDQNNHPPLRTVSEQPPSAFLDYRAFLEAEFVTRKRQKSGAYTYRDFAADLGFGATTLLHQIIRGYRPLTAKTAGRILAVLKLDAREDAYFRGLVAYCNAATPPSRELHFQTLMELKRQLVTSELDQAFLEYFSEWYHPVIREMVAMAGFVPDSAWIGAQLAPPVRPEKVKQSLALLERLGFIVYDEATHTYAQTQVQVSTGDRVRGMGLLNYHQQMIDLGRDSIARVPAKRRNIGAITVCCDEETAQRLKGMINLFQQQLLAEAEKPNQKDQIYQVNIQLFPFTEAERTSPSPKTRKKAG